MTRVAARRSAAISLLAVMLGAGAAPAQEDKDVSHCRPDEVDMGDYCARLEPPSTDQESALRRVTPFRASSMMPGRTSDTPHQAQQLPAPGPVSDSVPEKALIENKSGNAAIASEAAPEGRESDPQAANARPSEASGEHGRPRAHRKKIGGFGVQFGVFSDQARAIEFARPLAEQGMAVMLAPVHRPDRTLWACIHGPFSDEQAAAEAAGRLRIDHRLSDTYIKPLDNLELTELSHDTTEK